MIGRLASGLRTASPNPLPKMGRVAENLDLVLRTPPIGVFGSVEPDGLAFDLGLTPVTFHALTPAVIGDSHGTTLDKKKSDSVPDG